MKKMFFYAQVLLSCALFASLSATDVEMVSIQESSPESRSWGYHLILDCRACDIPTVTNRDALENFIKVMVDAIHMKRYGEPIIEHFAEHNPEAAGYSLVQLIETSDITGHFVDKNGDAYIDVFSCKIIDPEAAVNVVQELLHPKNIKVRYVLRQA